MASQEGLQTRKLLATGTSIYVATDKAVALRLKALPAAGDVTSVATINATSVEVITAGGGTDTYLFSAFTTIGALADAIKADGIFEVRVLDILRSAASDDALLTESITTSTLDEEGNAVFDVKVDTNLMFGIAACLSGSRSGSGDVNSKGHRILLKQIDYVANMGTAANEQLVITARNIVTGAERTIWKGLTVDTTATEVVFAKGYGSIDTKNGEEIIVSIKDAASLADGAYIRLAGVVE